MPLKNDGRVRPDGIEKVTGTLKYLTDRQMEGMLYGRVLRSRYPHALIKRIQTEEAAAHPGVEAVITAADVPGLNGFGIVVPNQPVFCESRVRYMGDAVAAVAAVSKEAAEEALEKIIVEYEELPILDTMEKSLAAEAPGLHEEGNILHQAEQKRGRVEDAFASCEVVVEETYETPRQMHTYMETEGGVVVPEAGGGITVYMGTQHGLKDRFQLSRILDMEEESIRVVSSPMGGSFGGKDELNVQPYAALLALKTGKPVQIHNSRKESVRAGIKRHAMKIKMKTGVDKKGKLIAHQTYIEADTGAYATLGPAILEFAVEHASGPYDIDHVHTKGLSIYTNNGVAGEFRGFGGNQITFALEGQISRLASALNMNLHDFQAFNMRKHESPGPLGHRIAPTNGGQLVLEAVDRIREEKQLELIDKPPAAKYMKRGLGTAVTMHGGGLGYGRLDPSGGMIRLNQEGKIEGVFGFEECGQGIVAVIENTLVQAFECSREDVCFLIGDTEKVPVSGSTTASRGTSMVYHAVQRLKPLFQQQLFERAATVLEKKPEDFYTGKGGVYLLETKEQVLSYRELAEASPDEKLEVQTTFDFPVTPDEIDSGHFLYTFGAVLVEIEIDMRLGRIKVIDLQHAVAAGPVVNPKGYRGQVEGGGVMSVGYSLMENAAMTNGQYDTDNLDTYMIPSIQDVPAVMAVEAIEDLYEEDQYGPRGVGEIGTVAVAPAIAEAVFQAVGTHVTSIPISREVLMNLGRKENADEIRA